MFIEKSAADERGLPRIKFQGFEKALHEGHEDGHEGHEERQENSDWNRFVENPSNSPLQLFTLFLRALRASFVFFVSSF
ncbi:MAG: hypothetical protein WD397_15740 [Wenzhouxiangellaceae bacterium]